MRSFLPILSLFALSLPVAMAAESATYGAVAAIMTARCNECHGAGKFKGKLRLHTLEDMVKGGKGGPAVVANKPEESPLLLRASLPAGNEDRMPPEGEPLSAQELATIRAWIAAGAKP